MLLKSVSAVNSRGHVLNLPLDDPDAGFTVRDIQGLGPVKAEVVSSRFATLDGEQFHSSHRVKRNIIYNLGLHPDYGQQSTYDLRNQLYAYFMPKTAIKLKFELYDKFAEETLNVEIDGIVEYAEPSIFSKDPNIDVSILCHQPDFIDPTVITVNGASVDDLIYADIDYKGTIDTGVLFKLNADRLLSADSYDYAFQLTQLRPDGLTSSMDYTENLEDEDILSINTSPTNKYVSLERDSVNVGKVYALEVPFDWIMLAPGLNRILVNAANDVVGVPWTIEYVNRYGGI